MVLTRDDNDSVGPCVDERAHIASRSRAAISVLIHADGGPPSGFGSGSGSGFHIIEPVLIAGLTDDIFERSHRLAIETCARQFAAHGRATFRHAGREGITVIVSRPASLTASTVFSRGSDGAPATSTRL